MFNNKKDKKVEKSSENNNDFNVQSMPGEFYGGANPVIEFKKVKKEVDPNKFVPQKTTKVERKEFDKKNTKGVNLKKHPANLFTNTKFLLLAAGVIFVVAIIIGGIYYWLQAKETTSNTNQSSSNVSTVVSTPDVDTTSSDISTITDINTPTTTSDSEHNTTSSLSVDVIAFPSILLGRGQDFDGDGLSDKEEKIFGSDPSIVDSDKDTYQDGYEVYNLYTPNGIQPKRLIDSDDIMEYKNPSYNYTLYYPKGWTYGSVDYDYKDILFTSSEGEGVEIKVYDLEGGQIFSEWFSKYAKGEVFDSLTNFESVFKQVGKVRSDKLVYYFVDNNIVYVVVYQASKERQVNYGSIMEMMARSFKTGNNSYSKVWPKDISGITSTSTTSTININSTSTIKTSTSTVVSTSTQN
jgi:hypothetical protein